MKPPRHQTGNGQVGTSDIQFAERSVRLDEATGTTQATYFIGSAGKQMLAHLHLPDGDVLGAVVICSPVKAEMTRNHRREMLLSGVLASRGYAVQRFEYRGTGSSDGHSRHLTFETMIEDAAAVTDDLLRRVSTDAVAFIGTRLASLVAAAVSSRHEGAPLVLWEPVVTTRQYFREVFRNRLVGDLYTGETRPNMSTEALMDDLQRLGFVEVLGFSIDRPLYESFDDKRLEDTLPSDRRPILLVQMSRSDELRRDYVALQESRQASGQRFDAVVAGREVAWWFEGDWPPSTVDEAPAIPPIADWLADRLSESASSVGGSA